MKHTWMVKFVETEEEAKAFCSSCNKSATPYVRRRYPSHYTPWESMDHKEKLFCCWYAW